MISLEVRGLHVAFISIHSQSWPSTRLLVGSRKSCDDGMKGVWILPFEGKLCKLQRPGMANPGAHPVLPAATN